MLLKLMIKDYILIDNLEIDFDRGLNILTGETGAGKSIILGAIRLVLGGRLAGNVIRAGADKARLQAVFVVETRHRDLLKDYLSDEDELIVFSREIDHNSRSVAKINDQVCTNSTIRHFADIMLNIHGQNDAQQILENKGQLFILDAFLEEPAKVLKSELARVYQSIHALDLEIATLVESPEQIERERDMLAYQMTEIDEADLSDEDENIEERFKTIKHAEHIQHNLYNARTLIQTEDYEAVDLSAMLNRLITELNHTVNYLPNMVHQVEIVEDLSFRLSEVYELIVRASDQMSFSEEALYSTEKRMDIVNQLKRKYGNSVAKIVRYRQVIEERYQQLNDAAEMKDRLLTKRTQFCQTYQELADKLSSARRVAAQSLAEKLSDQLKDLGFDYVAIDTAFSKRNEQHTLGQDQIDIMLSLNRGIGLQPLKQVVSGGEISRIMLAIKSIMASADAVDVLIFDEIDSGISGVTASVVARKLHAIAKYHQVIAITHLAQVAMMADRHFSIVKDTAREQAISKVIPLTHSQQIDELARIMGGEQVDPQLVSQVTEMLARAKKEQ